jgi:hypothetical protein
MPIASSPEFTRLPGQALRPTSLVHQPYLPLVENAASFDLPEGRADDGRLPAGPPGPRRDAATANLGATQRERLQCHQT